MQRITQSPTDPAFVQNPYGFYDRARALGPVVWWEDYAMPCALSYAAVNAILRDRRFGREEPPEQRAPLPDHLAPFYAVEAHSMLELEPPRHTRLRSLVLRAFTSRRIAGLAPEITALCTDLAQNLPKGPFDFLEHFGQKLPIIVIARLLGVPEDMGPQLLRWSNAMVGMYQAARTRAMEDAAVQATTEFVAFMRGYVDQRRAKPADDLITQLIAASDDGEKLSTDELITTCILLLNAGHEATVHSLGIAVKTLIEHQATTALGPDHIDATVEETLRFDPPLHLFARWAYEDIDVMGHQFRRGDKVACLLGAANRDPAMFDAPHRFNPSRPPKPNLAFGAGLHFCVGAPLARLELTIALPILFATHPSLRLAEAPRFGNVYHFHGLERLMLTTG